MAKNENKTKKNNKKSKFERKICPECGEILQRHGYYGKNKIIRYTCKNPKCSIKTISNIALLRAQSGENKYQKFYTVISKFLDHAGVANVLHEKIGITGALANKFIRNILEHQEVAIDKYFPTLYVSPKVLIKIICHYKLRIPYIAIFPTSDETFYCCVADPCPKSIAPKGKSGFEEHYKNLLNGIRNNSSKIIQ
ncbi:MAG: hypothetical protein E7Z87_08475 [Cyanobacteria bacterium SIG26]|nr:hypothetical protein [Cyanobacteria bacterium SIG26]